MVNGPIAHGSLPGCKFSASLYKTVQKPVLYGPQPVANGPNPGNKCLTSRYQMIHGQVAHGPWLGSKWVNGPVANGAKPVSK